MVKVRDIMTREFISVPPSTPIIKVAQEMRNSRTGAIPVCDKGKFRGVITERDIVIGIVANACNPKREHAGSLVNIRHPIISPGEEIMQAAKVMVNHGVRVLPVAQSGKLLGLFTLDDLTRESLTMAAVVFTQTARPKAANKVRVYR